jgi:excisionase family DNA binding protein
MIGTATRDRLLTVDELAQALGVKRSWVYAKSKEGAIPTVYVGRYLRFELERVRASLASAAQAARRARPE